MAVARARKVQALLVLLQCHEKVVYVSRDVVVSILISNPTPLVGWSKVTEARGGEHPLIYGVLLPHRTCRLHTLVVGTTPILSHTTHNTHNLALHHPLLF